MQTSHKSAVISAVAHHLPEQVLSSRQVEDKVNSNANGFKLPNSMLARMSGVENRHHVTNGDSSSDLASQAAKKAIEKAGLKPENIDALIFAAASHDVAEPATANLVQAKTGCKNAHVVDVKNACNSFLNALDFALLMIQAGRAERILVAAGEVLSPFIDWRIGSMKECTYKMAALTLGDGGAACVVEASDDPDRGLFPGTFYSDGDHWELSTILAGGTIMARDFSRMYFECDSRKLQKLAVSHLPRVIDKAISGLGWSLQKDVKLAVPHQVSKHVIQLLCKAIKFPFEKTMVTLTNVGNTAAASVPIALSIANEQGYLERGDKVLLIGGAAGFSASVIPVVW